MNVVFRLCAPYPLGWVCAVKCACDLRAWLAMATGMANHKRSEVPGQMLLCTNFTLSDSQGDSCHNKLAHRSSCVKPTQPKRVAPKPTASKENTRACKITFNQRCATFHLKFCVCLCVIQVCAKVPPASLVHGMIGSSWGRPRRLRVHLDFMCFTHRLTVPRSMIRSNIHL
eukprot:4309755-Amphidinium_carterae.1